MDCADARLGGGRRTLSTPSVSTSSQKREVDESSMPLVPVWGRGDLLFPSKPLRRIKLNGTRLARDKLVIRGRRVRVDRKLFTLRRGSWVEPSLLGVEGFAGIAGSQSCGSVERCVGFGCVVRVWWGCVGAGDLLHPQGLRLERRRLLRFHKDC